MKLWMAKCVKTQECPVVPSGLRRVGDRVGVAARPTVTCDVARKKHSGAKPADASTADERVRHALPRLTPQTWSRCDTSREVGPDGWTDEERGPVDVG